MCPPNLFAHLSHCLLPLAKTFPFCCLCFKLVFLLPIFFFLLWAFCEKFSLNQISSSQSSSNAHQCSVHQTERTRHTGGHPIKPLPPIHLICPRALQCLISREFQQCHLTISAGLSVLSRSYTQCLKVPLKITMGCLLR